MSRYTYLTSSHYMIANTSTSCNAGHSCENTIVANNYIVSNMAKIIKKSILSDYSVSKTTSINGAIWSYVNISLNYYSSYMKYSNIFIFAYSKTKPLLS